MIKGLFINNIKAKDSIYESGMMVYNCLLLSKKYHLEYIEVSKDHRTIPLDYDFYFFNYHPSTMAWMDTSSLKNIPGIIITMILEVLPNDPFVMCPDNHFHGYCVLDPTVSLKNKKVFPFPRPLDTVITPPVYIEKNIPVIGSFGFATKGKGFQHVVEAVNNEFERAVVRINIPYGDFVPDSEQYAKLLADVCKQKAKKGIEVVVTHDYMEKDELIEWCGQNTLNCFLYDRNMPGLAATTDQAIVAGRPLAVSQNDTFRHILAYLPAYPTISLKHSIENSTQWVRQMQSDWSPQSFAGKFELMLEELLIKVSLPKIGKEKFEIPVLKKSLVTKLRKKYRKYKRFFSIEKIKYQLTQVNNKKNEELI